MLKIMLGRLSGQTHEVYTAVALAVAPDSVLEALNITSVTFGEIPPEWIHEYCKGEEPMDKAGAYAVQGGTGQFIRRIDGSYSGVMGLPLFETAQILRQAGLLVISRSWHDAFIDLGHRRPALKWYAGAPDFDAGKQRPLTLGKSL